MDTRLTVIAVVLFGATCTHNGFAQDVEGLRTISGKVVDELGQPVPHADVADFWCIEGHAARPRPYLDEMTSIVHFEADETGIFTGTISADRPLRALMAMDSRRERVGFINIKEMKPGQSITIQLAPAVYVVGNVTCKSLDTRPKGISVAVMSPGTGQILDWMSKDTTARFSIPLPSGEFRLMIFSDETKPFAKDVTVDTDKRTVDLGSIDLAPSVLANHYGKALPEWKLTDARGISPDIKLSDFKGKWVFLEVWSHW